MAQALINQYAATVAGGLFAPSGAAVAVTGQLSGGGLRRKAAMALGRKGARAIREVMETLNGVVAGSAAVKTNGRVVAATELGGVRAVENEELVNANTTAGNVTTILNDVLTFSSTFGSSPPANLDGNPLGFR